MKKLLILIFILNIGILKSQDTIRIKHSNYITVFSKSLKYPILVKWSLSKDKVQCNSKSKRKEVFGPDPNLKNETDLLSDYKKSGYDRGHMCPAADNTCLGVKVLDESFYFSNMSPQNQKLNRGEWKELEEYCRELALTNDLIIYCGNIGSKKKIGRVSVPSKCWKVIYIKNKNEYLCYIFDNSPGDGNFQNNKIQKSELEKLLSVKIQ